MSRTALLDIFVMFWVLAAFGCLVVDRDRSRRQDRRGGCRGHDRRPRSAARHPLVAGAGRAVPRPCLRVQVERHLVHPRVRVPGLRPGISAPGGPPVSAVTPAARCSGTPAGCRSPSGWSRRLPTWPPGAAGSPPARGYDRNWAAQHGNHTPVLSALDSLYQYNKAMWQFGVALTTHHPYQSWPWTWLLMSRPVSFFYNSSSTTCGAKSCSQEVLAIGTPAIWWASIARARRLPALVACAAGTGGPGPYCWESRLAGCPGSGTPGTTTAPCSSSTRWRSSRSW